MKWQLELLVWNKSMLPIVARVEHVLLLIAGNLVMTYRKALNQNVGCQFIVSQCRIDYCGTAAQVLLNNHLFGPLKSFGRGQPQQHCPSWRSQKKRWVLERWKVAVLYMFACLSWGRSLKKSISKDDLHCTTFLNWNVGPLVSKVIMQILAGIWNESAGLELKNVMHFKFSATPETYE